MVLGPYKLLLQLVAVLAIGLALMVGGALLALSSGPVSLAFATPYIERALASPDSPNVVRVRDTVVAWDREGASVDLRALGVRIFDRERVQMIATAPSIGVRFSMRALLRGLLAPSVLEIEGATLRVRRLADGTLRLGFTSEQEEQTELGAEATGILTSLLLPPDPDNAAGYLHTLGVINATLRVDDQMNNARWVAREATVRLRRDQLAIDAEANARIDVNGLVADVQASGSFDLAERTTELSVSFNGIRPAALAAMERHATELQRVDMPIDGAFSLSLDPNGEIAAADFELLGGPGTVSLPELYGEPLALDAVFVKGRMQDHFNRLIIEDAFVDIRGVTGQLSGVVDRVAGDQIIMNVEAETSTVPIEHLRQLWPRELSRPARNWVVRNLADGVADSATLRLRGTAPIDDPFVFDSVDVRGQIAFSGVTVHYLRPMTPVTAGVGNATFDNTSFRITVNSGQSEELVVETAQIDLIQLDQPEPVADISLTVAGPARAALTLLDEEPLGFSSALGLDPSQVTGEQRTNAIIRVPLLSNVTTDMVDAAAAARLSEFTYPDGILGFPIDAGDLSLEVDKTELKVSGSLNLSGIPVEAVWTRALGDEDVPEQQFQLRGFLDDDERVRLGIATADWVTGPIGVGLTYTTNGEESGFGAAELDLSATRIELAPFAWQKEEGVEARGQFAFAVENDLVTGLPSFEFSAPELLAAGSLTFTSDGEFDIGEAVLSRLVVGETDVSGTLVTRDGHYEIGVTGASIDLRPFLEEGDEEPTEAAEPGTPFTVTILDGRLDQIRVTDDLYVSNVAGQLTFDGTVVRSADLTGLQSGSGAISLVVSGRPDGRDVSLRSEDAGELLRSFDLVETMIGGSLDVEATIDDIQEGQPVFGVLRIEDFQIVQRSALARMLTLTSFQGIEDVVAGNGITFRQLEAPFRLTEDAIDLKDVRARGSSLGILAEGRINRVDDTLDLAGEIAPAYTLNSLLGRIPIVGDVLTGGGQGIFAATYKVRGPIGDPTVSVNPLSVLTPGFTRRILSGFEGGLGSGDDADYTIDTPTENN